MSYRKLLPLLLAIASAGTIWAQNDYQVDVGTQAYKDLQPETVIGQGTAIEQAYAMRATFICRPYDSVFDLNTANFVVARNGYVAIDDSRTAWIIDACAGNYVPSDNSAMSVQLTSTVTGDRVMKIQWKNMRPASNPAGDYINFQLWFFEADNSVEVHIGPTHLTTLTTWNDSGPSVGMFLSSYSLGQFYHQTYLRGDASHPTASFKYDDVLAPLNNAPVAGTVYRFSLPGQGAGVERVAGRSAIAITPNPARDVAHITLPEELNGKHAVLHLYDALGRDVMTIDDVVDGSTIPTGTLARGIYFAVVTSGARRYDAGRLVTQ